MNDKETELVSDVTSENESSCCGAKIINGICMDCRDHATPIEEESEL